MKSKNLLAPQAFPDLRNKRISLVFHPGESTISLAGGYSEGACAQGDEIGRTCVIVATKTGDLSGYLRRTRRTWGDMHRFNAKSESCSLYSYESEVPYISGKTDIRIKSHVFPFAINEIPQNFVTSSSAFCYSFVDSEFRCVEILHWRHTERNCEEYPARGEMNLRYMGGWMHTKFCNSLKTKSWNSSFHVALYFFQSIARLIFWSRKASTEHYSFPPISAYIERFNIYCQRREHGIFIYTYGHVKWW